MSSSVSPKMCGAVDFLISAGSTGCGSASRPFLPDRSIWSPSLCRKSGCGARSKRTASLPSEKPLQRLNDILENVEWIFQYTKGLRFPNFVEDRLVRDGVERCLLRISEAA